MSQNSWENENSKNAKITKAKRKLFWFRFAFLCSLIVGCCLLIGSIFMFASNGMTSSKGVKFKIDIVAVSIALVVGILLCGASIFFGRVYFKLRKQWNDYQSRSGGE